MTPEIKVGCAMLAATMFIALPAPGEAGTCGYEYCWGSVAAGDNGNAARASGFRTAPGAWARADRVCRGKCSMIEVFSNGCGAIAQDSDGAMSAGFATTRTEAEAEAMAICDQQLGKACRVRVWACSK